MNKQLLILFAFIAIQAKSQSIEILNQYKYLVVDSRFDFAKVEDGYQTSSLTKFLLKKLGHQVFLDNEDLPDNLVEKRCNALYVKVVDYSNMLTTKSAIQFRDCTNKVVYTTPAGRSKFKEYKKAYHESIRRAFNSFEELEYKYVYIPKVLQDPVVEVPVKNEVNSTLNTGKKEKDSKPTKIIVKPSFPILYAQPKDDGFQLVNSEPKIVFYLLKTKSSDKYIIKDMNGTLTRKDGFWLAEYYINGELKEEKYSVKF